MNGLRRLSLVLLSLIALTGCEQDFCYNGLCLTIQGSPPPDQGVTGGGNSLVRLKNFGNLICDDGPVETTCWGSVISTPVHGRVDITSYPERGRVDIVDGLVSYTSISDGCESFQVWAPRNGEYRYVRIFVDNRYDMIGYYGSVDPVLEQDLKFMIDAYSYQVNPFPVLKKLRRLYETNRLNVLKRLPPQYRRIFISYGFIEPQHRKKGMIIGQDATEEEILNYVTEYVASAQEGPRSCLIGLDAYLKR